MATRASIGRVDVEYGSRGYEETTRQVDALGNRLRGASKRISTAFEKINSKVVAMRTSLLKLRFIAVAVFGAMAFAIARTIESMDRATSIARGFEALGARLGDTTGLLEQMTVATRGLVSAQELMRASNQAIALQIPVTAAGLTQLLQGAVKLGRALGLDTTQAIDSIITGIGRQSRLMLDNLGIVVRVTEAQESYARSIGKTASDLTEYEKRVAFTIASQEQLLISLRALANEAPTFAEVWKRGLTNVQTQWQALLDTINRNRGLMVLLTQQMPEDLREGFALSDAELAKVVSFGKLFRENFGAAVEELERMDATIDQVVASIEEQRALIADPLRGFAASDAREAIVELESSLKRLMLLRDRMWQEGMSQSDLTLRGLRDNIALIEELGDKHPAVRKLFDEWKKLADEIERAKQEQQFFRDASKMEPVGPAPSVTAGLLIPGVPLAAGGGPGTADDATRRLTEGVQIWNSLTQANSEFNSLLEKGAVGLLNYDTALSRVAETASMLSQINFEQLTPSFSAQREEILANMAATLQAADANEAMRVRQQLLVDVVQGTMNAFMQMAAAGKFSMRVLVAAIASQISATLAALAIENVVRGMMMNALALNPFLAPIAPQLQASAAAHFATAAKAGAGAVVFAGIAGAASRQSRPESAAGAIEDAGGPADLGGVSRPPAEIHIFIEGEGFITDTEELARTLAETIERQMNKGGVRG